MSHRKENLKKKKKLEMHKVECVGVISSCCKSKPSVCFNKHFSLKNKQTPWYKKQMN